MLCTVYSKPSVVEEACSGEGLPSGRMIGSGAWPKRYRPPPSLRNVLTIGWKFFTSSRLKLASPPPCLVRLSLVTGLKVLNELKKPPNSMCIRLPFTFGSNASLDIGMQVSAGCRCRRPDRSACWCKSEEHTSELQSLRHLVCRLLLE